MCCCVVNFVWCFASFLPCCEQREAERVRGSVVCGPCGEGAADLRTGIFLRRESRTTSRAANRPPARPPTHLLLPIPRAALFSPRRGSRARRYILIAIAEIAWNVLLHGCGAVRKGRVTRAGHVLVTCRSRAGHVLVTYWSRAGHVLVTYRSRAGHVLVTC